ncbi:MAG: hypothetical protein JSS02_29270 [Planctomycetes bacterium]|nr:hypothetical protein [Planctomycetota bacterium]
MSPVMAADVEALESRALLAFTYHGGNLITNVEAQNVYLGSDWSSNVALQKLEAKLDTFLTKMVGGIEIDGLTAAGYNVYRGTTTSSVVGNFTLDKSYPTTGYINGYYLVDTSSFTGGLADSTTQTGFSNSVQGLLQTMINAGTVQQPNANSLYMVYVEPGVIVTSADGANSVVDYYGFHSSFMGTTSEGASVNIRYAVMPFPGFPNSLYGGTTQVIATALNSLTTTASHELAEAITDPDVQLAIDTGDLSYLGWYDLTNNGEVADLSAGFLTINQGFVLQLVENKNNELINPGVVTHTLKAPSNLRLSGSTGTTATLTWTNNSPLTQGFRIFGVTNGVQSLLGTVAVGTTSFTVPAAKSYFVQAYDGPTTSNSPSLSSGSLFPGLAAARVSSALVNSTSSTSNNTPSNHSSKPAVFVSTGNGHYVVSGQHVNLRRTFRLPAATAGVHH